MREFDPMTSYPPPKKPRIVSRNLRTIQNRIRACYRGKEFYDGDRNDGFGGYVYDGRWKSVAEDMLAAYDLDRNGPIRILHIGCDKGFLLYEFSKLCPNAVLRGTEVSSYPIETSMAEIREHIQLAPFTELPFDDHSFDLVIAIGPVYTLNLRDAISCLTEIERVGTGKSFITLGSYTNEEEYWLFRDWSLLGTQILKPEEWRALMEHAGYSGDYKFTGAQSLNLVREGAVPAATV